MTDDNMHEEDETSPLLASTTTAAAQDSFLWAPIDNFKLPIQRQYWEDLCNGTNMVNNPLPGDVARINVTKVLHDWPVHKDNTCKELHEPEYTTVTEALTNCGRSCSGIVDVSCTGSAASNSSNSSAAPQKFRLCVATSSHGSIAKQAAGSCVIEKPDNYNEPEDLPRPPQELAYWHDFCEYRRTGRTIRVMYPREICGDGEMKDFGEAANPVECAAKVKEDDECAAGLVFDFRFGPPTVCRCLKASNSCVNHHEAADGNVWASSLEEALPPPATTTTPLPGVVVTPAPANATTTAAAASDTTTTAASDTTTTAASDTTTTAASDATTTAASDATTTVASR
jgi:hypothetical protein